MVIVGAGGFAKELAQVALDVKGLDSLIFFDDYNPDPQNVFDVYPVLKNLDEVENYFEDIGSRRYVLGIGTPQKRKHIVEKFAKIDGELTSLISPHAQIGHFVEIGNGGTILSNCSISNSAIIGKGVLIYYNVVITHDCKIGDFVELSPGATILGKVQVGDFTHIGANATILPEVKIGKNVTVGAGAVVTKDVCDNCVVVGIPAKVVKEEDK